MNHKPEVLKSWRDEANLSQKALANMIGAARCTVSRAETADRDVSLEIVGKIATTLGKSLSDALTDEARERLADRGLIPH